MTDEQNAAAASTPAADAAKLLAEYVADLIDYHQGWLPHAPHADLETLGGAVHTIIGRRQPRTQAALDL
jgi:hypothetical protein